MPNQSQLQPYAVTCEGGLILDKSTFSVPPGAAFALQNYEANIDGGYRRISGFQKYSTTALSGTGRVLGVHIYNEKVIGCRGSNVQWGTGSTWTTITSARSSAGVYVFDNYDWTGTKKMIMADGINYAATWDGTTYTLMNGSAGGGAGTAPTAPTCVVEHMKHMWYGQGNILTFSAPYSENDFTTGNGAGQIIIPEGIKAIKSFRNVLIVFCQTAIYKITGTSLSDFAFSPITRNIGCTAPWSVQEIGGDLVYLAQDGIRTIAGTERIDDIELGTISKPVQSRLKGKSETTGESFISSCVIRNKSQYRIWFSANSTPTSAVPGVIGVFKRRAYGQIQSPAAVNDPTQGVGWEFSDIMGMKPSYATSGYLAAIETVLHGGMDDGLIYKQETGSDFDGTAIQSFYRSPDLIVNDPGLRKNVQRIILNLENEGTTVASLNVIYDFNDPDIPQPTSVSIDTSSGLAIYGDASAVYGTAVYGTPKLNYERIPVEGGGFTVAIKITDTGSGDPFSIKGFQIEYTEGGRR